MRETMWSLKSYQKLDKSEQYSKNIVDDSGLRTKRRNLFFNVESCRPKNMVQCTSGM